MKEFTTLVANPLMNMSHIMRYSGVKLVEPEALDTHIVDVMMLGTMLIDELNANYGETLYDGTFLEKALHHDLDESLTGDITRTLKYHNEDVHKELQKVAEETAGMMYARYFNCNHYYYSVWDNAKHGKEGGIVKIADMLDVAIKALREVKLLGNKYALRIVYEVKHYLNDTLIPFLNYNSPYNKQATDYLKDYILDVIKELEDVWNEEDNQAFIQHYNILDTTIFS